MNILNLFVDTQRVKNMTRGNWLINSNRSEVRRFTEDRANKDQFNKYIFIDNGKIETDKYKTISMDYEHFEFICRYLES